MPVFEGGFFDMYDIDGSLMGRHEFGDGPRGLYEFIYAHLRYPVPALKNHVTGIVTVEFVINTFGETTNIRLLQGIDDDCDAEALRVVKRMGETMSWTPGMHNGNPVNVTFTLPIKFDIRPE